MDIKTFRRATPSSVGRSGKIGQRHSAFLLWEFDFHDFSTVSQEPCWCRCRVLCVWSYAWFCASVHRCLLLTSLLLCSRRSHFLLLNQRLKEQKRYKPWMHNLRTLSNKMYTKTLPDMLLQIVSCSRWSSGRENIKNFTRKTYKSTCPSWCVPVLLQCSIEAVYSENHWAHLAQYTRAIADYYNEPYQ